jgi:selenide, water dikinase
MSEVQQQTEYRLTEYSHGGGCGCKIAPSVLQEILHSETELPLDINLLVGNRSNDDAAVYKLNDDLAIISTTDFFMPIVDDAYTFGQVAAANSISDVYAMGGKPVMAIAILGWPVNSLPASLAQQVLEGARNKCAEAGITLAGGHSIDSKEPIFGLSVNGIIHPSDLKKNDTANEGDYLLLTKKLGVGILSAAAKRSLLSDEDKTILHKQLVQLNSIGAVLGKIKGVTAMTDVTGFGILGHAMEMAKGSGKSAEIYYEKLPILESARGFAAQRVNPDATFRNWNAYSKDVKIEGSINVMEAFTILPDPQTNGGLLIAVSPASLSEVQQIMIENGYSEFTEPVGRMLPKEETVIFIR